MGYGNFHLSQFMKFSSAFHQFVRFACLLFYIPATSKVISVPVLTCDSAGTHGDFIVLSHWDNRPPAPRPAIPLRHIILTLSRPVLALS